MRSFDFYFVILIIYLFLDFFSDRRCKEYVWNLEKFAVEYLKKANCPSNGSKWKIYSFDTEETSQM
jgi:hypothetical protein